MEPGQSAAGGGMEAGPQPRNTASAAGPARQSLANDLQASSVTKSAGSASTPEGQNGLPEWRRQPSHHPFPGHAAGLAASRPNTASPSHSASDGGLRSDPSGPTSPAPSHPRPPSALSSTSSSHPRNLSSPRSNQPSYPSSSLSSAAAFDYDDLLGPRRNPGATSGPSLSPPSSTEDDKRLGEARLRGLGLDSDSLDAPGHTGADREQRFVHPGYPNHPFASRTASGGDLDETWLRLDAIKLDGPLSSPPGASNASSSSHYGSHTGGGAGQPAGSPLSPHVTPFAPAAPQLDARNHQTPWSSSANASSLASLAERAREREASWTSSSPGIGSTTSSQRAFPNLSSPSSFTSSPAISTSSHSAAGQTYFTARTPVQSSSMFGFTSTVQETPTSATSPDVYPTRHPSYASTLMPEPPSSREVGSDRGVLPRLGSLQAIPTSSGPASTSGAESVSSGTIDEVTTVFVVGFPDDVTEREFQNMFTFAEGFEAASLTVPSQSGEDSSARPTQEEAPPFSGLPQYIIQATRDPFALPRELGGAVTNVTSGGGATTGPTPRKQIIGFARFCSRQHALAAAEVLSGRKIDPEKAMVLKAEMAKKNLHFRKSLLPPSTTGTDSPAPIAASAVVDGPTGAARPATGASSLAPSNGPQVAPGQGSFPSEMRRHPSMVPSGLEAAAASVAAAATSAASAMGGSGPSIPLSALDSATLAKLASVSNLNPAVLAEIARQSALAGGPVQKPAPGPDQGYEARGRSRSYRQGSFEDYAAEPSDVYSESITASSSTASQPRSHSSAADAAFGTLYVGGLPAVLPSLTGPFSASHLEDSLRNAFSRCPGFKRLQFRSKSNGPIVFVEFVDTAHATRAMQELYGHTLGGLVKGGIRLSYSRNPLGVRSNGPPQGGSLLPGHGASAMVGLDGPSASSYASSPFGPASSSAVPCHPQFDPFDSHRRPPDPIYGENPARSPPAMSPLAQPSSLSSYRFGAPGQVSPPATSASLYGGNFSPFGFDP
ncbi:hypothetical protein BMF94_5495 [Rhodotorula taiwanensis]|uniref:RRM domain-containing protein n=1 Tax=Rhodotorula taiwanensis TaxID=741276 RepID=A0A2S5B357_9BASI|nr:hypothetical protein BMF94_5495 [Rhodotorula taiwanensis]